jgi:hypothetical protein
MPRPGGGLIVTAAEPGWWASGRSELMRLLPGVFRCEWRLCIAISRAGLIAPLDGHADAIGAGSHQASCAACSHPFFFSEIGLRSMPLGLLGAVTGEQSQ